MQQNFTFAIRKKYNDLRPSEKKVADVLLSTDFDIVNGSIEALALRAQVSQPTIIRFANAMGLKGFRELRNRLTAEKIKQDAQDVRRQVVSFPVSAQDKLIDTPAKVITTHVKHLEDMLKNLSAYALLRTVDSIIQSKRIVLFGVENSTCVADDLRTKLLYMGFHVEFHADPYLQTISARNLSAGDVSIGISYSGSSKITVDALRTAKQAGATTISITNFEKSLINQYADIMLCTGNEQYLYGNAIFSRCTQIALVDMIYTGILTADYDRYSDAIAQNGKGIADFAYQA